LWLPRERIESKGPGRRREWGRLRLMRCSIFRNETKKKINFQDGGNDFSKEKGGRGNIIEKTTL